MHIRKVINLLVANLGRHAHRLSVCLLTCGLVSQNDTEMIKEVFQVMHDSGLSGAFFCVSLVPLLFFN